MKIYYDAECNIISGILELSHLTIYENHTGISKIDNEFLKYIKGLIKKGIIIELGEL